MTENTVVVQETPENNVIIISSQGPQGIPGPPGEMGNIDGGSANSIYTNNQLIDGGTAGSF
jgi:hypothetical protein